MLLYVVCSIKLTDKACTYRVYRLLCIELTNGMMVEADFLIKRLLVKKSYPT